MKTDIEVKTIGDVQFEVTARGQTAAKARYTPLKEVPMATLARRLRLGVTSIFLLSGLVGTLWGQYPFKAPFPPPIQFINNAQIRGTLQTQGKTLPITGSLDYLIIGNSPHTRQVLAAAGQQTRSGEVYNITQTSTTYDAATYSWTSAGTGPAIHPFVGEVITVTGTANGNGIFNVTDAVIEEILSEGPTSGSFLIDLYALPTIAAAPETGQAQVVGNYLWVASTPTGSNESELVPADLTTEKEVLSGDTWLVDFAGDLVSNSKTVTAQCAAWQNPSPNVWDRECTVNVQGNEGTLDISVVLNGLYVTSWAEKTTIGGNMTDSLSFTVINQGNFPPDSSIFNLPSVFNAPKTATNQGGNDNSQEPCSSTIPSFCLQAQ
jgi:hypothetical protein